VAETIEDVTVTKKFCNEKCVVEEARGRNEIRKAEKLYYGKRV
jgi:hypothetical protein